MDNMELFYELLRADGEKDVSAALVRGGYPDDSSQHWEPLGKLENNFSIVGNQQENPTGALVDKLINGIDAVLMSECFRAQINPESSEAPQSMSEAVDRFLGLAGGRLDGIDARARTKLAERLGLRLIAVGSKRSPSYLIVDAGEGRRRRDSQIHFYRSASRTNSAYLSFRENLTRVARECCSSVAKTTTSLLSLGGTPTPLLSTGQETIHDTSGASHWCADYFRLGAAEALCMCISHRRAMY